MEEGKVYRVNMPQTVKLTIVSYQAIKARTLKLTLAI
jgi:hypothetical protein